MHFGVNWKLRAMYTMQNISNFQDEWEFTNVNFTNNDQFMFSILVMPFSWDWEQSKW